MSKQPKREKCLDGMLLAWVLGSDQWTVVHFDQYIMNPFCFGDWHYLPSPPRELYLSNMSLAAIIIGLKVEHTNIGIKGVVCGVVSVGDEPCIQIQWETDGAYTIAPHYRLTHVKVIPG